MSQAPRHTRRWFQFSVGTMLAVVTLFAALLGWELNRVRKRQALRQSIVDRGGLLDVRVGLFRRMPSDVPTVPFWRRWLGDKPSWDITLKVDAPFNQQEIERIQHAFPEVNVVAIPKELQ